jgi:hypothetical protein
LPQQISSTAPSLSGASNFFTKIPSSYIFFTENPREIPTVKGRPSGAATIRKTITTVIYYGSFAKRRPPIPNLASSF